MYEFALWLFSVYALGVVLILAGLIFFAWPYNVLLGLPGVAIVGFTLFIYIKT
ncbi:MAG: hypothetical protein WAX89_01335 [Alphaproteobacteria bacterium]